MRKESKKRKKEDLPGREANRRGERIAQLSSFNLIEEKKLKKKAS